MSCNRRENYVFKSYKIDQEFSFFRVSFSESYTVCPTADVTIEIWKMLIRKLFRDWWGRSSVHWSVKTNNFINQKGGGILLLLIHSCSIILCRWQSFESKQMHNVQHQHYFYSFKAVNYTWSHTSDRKLILALKKLHERGQCIFFAISDGQYFLQNKFLGQTAS